MDAPCLPVGLTAGLAQQGVGEEEDGWFFFPFFILKLKSPKKRKCCPCNFGRDFQLLFSLSEWQISPSVLEGARGRTEALNRPGTKKDPRERKMRRKSQRDKGSQE